MTYPDLCGSLRQAAKDAEVTLRSSRTPPAVQLQEQQVQLLGTTQVTAKLLIIAHDRPAEVQRQLALPVRTASDFPLTVAALDVPVGKKRSGKRTLHVLEMPERSELGLFFIVGEHLHLRVISTSPASGTRAAELSRMVARLQQAEILPWDLPLGRARGAVWHPPAGMALEMETHVAKRCLLAGTAGGFVESITGQTAYSSVRSALLAAEAALSALKHRDTQETLGKFKTTWREHLADSLRPPSTSLRLLMPLLFANQNIVERFTRALIFGDNI